MVSPCREGTCPARRYQQRSRKPRRQRCRPRTRQHWNVRGFDESVRLLRTTIRLLRAAWPGGADRVAERRGQPLRDILARGLPQRCSMGEMGIERMRKPDLPIRRFVKVAVGKGGDSEEFK